MHDTDNVNFRTNFEGSNGSGVQYTVNCHCIYTVYIAVGEITDSNGFAMSFTDFCTWK